MVTGNQEILITLLGGAFLLLILVIVVVIATMRYPNRKQDHMLDLQRMKLEGAQQLLKVKVEVQEEIFKDVSQEIHDNIGQILSLVKLNLHAVRVKDRKSADQISTTIELVNRALGDLRNLSKRINADFITQQSLSCLLQREVDTINKAPVAFTLTVQTEGNEVNLVPEKKLVTFRIAQECLQNAIKHSKASTIKLYIQFSAGQCTITITDNGVGFHYESVKTGNGFTHLRSRASAIQASLNIDSAPGVGTCIRIVIPLS